MDCISVIIIILGLSLLIFNLKNKQNKRNLNETISVIFSKMFKQPDIWMGYADLDIKEKLNK